MKIKIIELFAGIGACSKALENIGIDVEIVDAVEIDKYAIKSFNAIHGTNFEPQDVVEWDKDLSDIDLISHGSPCQDFSLAGKQAGGDYGSGTRSSLMYETVRIVEKIRPKYVVWENVKNLLSKKHKHNFDRYIYILEQLGYISYYQVLNAKDYGIPQNRERVYTISIRKDIANDFIFPEKEQLELKLKDLLENNVDEKYYLSDKMIKTLLSDTNNWVISEKKYEINRDIARTINTREGCYRTDASEYICNELPSNFNILRIKNATKKGYIEATEGDGITLSYINSNTRRGRVGNQVSQTLQCNDSVGAVVKNKIRKLTPLECWRLMGFDDDDFYKAQAVPTSNTQLYKQAGNSIVVKVLEKIFKNLFKEGVKKNDDSKG